MIGYKYVFFLGDKYERNYFYELENVSNTFLIYKNQFSNNTLINIFFRISFSQKLNNYHICFWKSIWFKKIIKKINYNPNSRYVFVFNQGWYDKRLIKWLVKHHSSIIRVIYFDDTVDYYSSVIHSLKPCYLKNEFNYVLCYNPLDVKKYGFIQTQAFFSKINIKIPSLVKTDLCFVGQPKDRLNFLISIYEKIKNQVSCNFILPGSNIDHLPSGIVSLNKILTYKEYLEEELSSNCILEIIKGDTEGATFRCWEAVYYNKKLLTNWKGIYSFKYYNPNYMQYFETPDDIQIDFVRKQIEVDYHYENDNSPIRIIPFIDKLIKNNS